MQFVQPLEEFASHQGCGDTGHRDWQEDRPTRSHEQVTTRTMGFIRSEGVDIIGIGAASGIAEAACDRMGEWEEMGMDDCTI